MLPTHTAALLSSQTVALLTSMYALFTPAPPTPHPTHTHCAGPRAAGGYVFADPNPFLLDTDSLAKGKDLFRRGVLTGKPAVGGVRGEGKQGRGQGGGGERSGASSGSKPPASLSPPRKPVISFFVC